MKKISKHIGIDGLNGEKSYRFGKKWNDNQRNAIKNRVIIYTEERRKQHSEFMKSNNPFKGKKHSAETKLKISLAKKGKITKNTGKKFTEERKENMRIKAKFNFDNNPLIRENQKRASIKGTEATKLKNMEAKLQNVLA